MDSKSLSNKIKPSINDLPSITDMSLAYIILKFNTYDDNILFEVYFIADNL